MTIQTPPAESVAAACRFATLLRDPDFRRSVTRRGYATGITVYIGGPGEDEATVRARMEPGVAVCAIPDGTAAFGFRIERMEIPGAPAKCGDPYDCRRPHGCDIP